MGMTTRKLAFIDYYKSTGNATEAAKSAGYAPKYANRMGWRLLQDVEISRQLAEFTKSRQEKYSKENFVDCAWKEYETLDEQPSKIRALELAGKALGYIGASNDTKPNQSLAVTQININAIESSSSSADLWSLTRKLLSDI